MFFGVVLAIGIVSAFVFFVREPFVRVQAIVIEGEEALSEQEISAALGAHLLGTYATVIPRDSIFFYPREAMERDLSERFKRLKEVEVSGVGFDSIQVTLDERTPAYLWCGKEKEVVTTGCYFLDNEGYVFERAPTFSGSVLVRFYGPLEEGEASLSYTTEEDAAGRFFLTSRQFAPLAAFLGSATALSLTPSYLVKKESGDAELYLKEGGKVVISLKEDMEKTLSNLESALDAEPLKSDMAKRRSALQYIDLRFGNKVFFKFD